MRLVACPACSQHVRPDDSRCPHCAAPLKTTTAPLPSLVLLGLALAGCPADDYREDLPAATSSETTAPTSSVSNSSTSVGTSGESSGTSTTDVTIASEAAYGVPETESDSITDTADTSTGTGTGTDSSSGSSDTTDGSSTGGSSTGGSSTG